MLARATTHALVGLDARPIEVEAHLQRGVPAFAIVGLPDKACQEAKERVRSGIASAELEWPLRRITVNLAPADLRKEGSGFDLPIALAILAASQPGAASSGSSEHAALGELALDGRVRPVRGAIVAAEAALDAGLTKLVCAAESAAEAALAGVEPVPVRHLAEAAAYLRGRFEPEPVIQPPAALARAAARPRRRPRPGAGATRARDRRRRAATTSCSAGRPAPGRRCSRAGCPGILPPLTRTRRSR